MVGARTGWWFSSSAAAKKYGCIFSHIHIFGNSLSRKNYLFYIFVHTYGCDQELNYQIGLYTLFLYIYINVVFPAQAKYFYIFSRFYAETIPLNYS